MLDLIGVSGTPSHVGEQIRRRSDFANRVSLILYNETEPDAVTDLVRSANAAIDARGPVTE